MKNSKIEWTDHTVNLWHGCSKVHAGCDNCYAEKTSIRWGKGDIWGNTHRLQIKSAFNDLRKLQKAAATANENHKVFIGSMMDIFEKPMNLKGQAGADTGDLRRILFDKINAQVYPNLIFLFLTKRPSNINKYIPESWIENPPSNVWFGVSISDQKTAEILIPHLEKVNGNRFLSVEPQIEDIEITAYLFQHRIHWVIQGGESGPGKRHFNTYWADHLRAQCRLNKVPYFFKQIDKVQEIPPRLNVREFPNYSPFLK